MATPTHCTLYNGRVRLGPVERALAATQHSSPIVSITTGPERQALPGPGAAVQPAPGRRHLQPARRRLQRASRCKLDRDDGDQFLGDLNFRMPPGFTGNLRGISYCPEERDRGRRAERSAACEQAAPSCPASSEIGTTQRRRRAREPPLPRGRQDVPGGARSRARPLSLGRGHAGPGRALRLRRRRRPGRAPRRSADRPGHRGLRHGAERSSAASRSGCARSRSTSTSPTSRSTRPTARRSRSTRRGSATRAR